MVGMVKRVELRHRSKFCGYLSNCSWDFSKMAAALLPYLYLPASLQLTALGVLYMLPVFQRLGDAYSF